MENESNKPYFLLVFEYGDSMPTIISADIISEIYPDVMKQKLEVITKNGDDFDFENVTNFKIVPAEEINFNM